MTDILRDLEGVEKLTPRERECLMLVNQHLSSKEIGRRLGLSKYTVDDHLAEASRRLGVATRRAAAQKLAAHEALLNERRTLPDTPPNASGPYALGMAQTPVLPPDGQATGGTRDVGSNGREHGANSATAVAHAGLDLGSAGAAADPSGRQSGAARNGAVAGFGHAQAVDLPAPGARASGGAVPGLLHRGRGDLLAAWRGTGGPELGLGHRLGRVLTVALMGGAAFAGVIGVTYGAMVLLQHLKDTWFALLR
ncbi:MAG: hypothetical protein JSR45_02370 [Proteobacteria bacterium]|nr:hypothetical protein [Pseudomonadota bacterium]